MKSLDGLVKNAEDELTYLENSVQSNLDWSTKMEGALKMIQRTAQRERAHTNKLGGLYGSLTQQVLAFSLYLYVDWKDAKIILRCVSLFRSVDCL